MKSMRCTKDYVPTVMRKRTSADKSVALQRLADVIFEGARFEDVKTGLGIVATRWDFEKPMIFKASVAQAHGSKGTFVPGFRCTISDAVQASCSAYPFFDRKILTTGTGDRVELIDGGYCANNPTLYAIADAVMTLKKEYADLRVVSVGVGIYPEPKKSTWQKLVGQLQSVQLLQKTLNINTISMDTLRTVLFKQVATLRISDTFEKPEMATDLLEHNLTKLNLLYQRGRESFARQEEQLKQFLL
jgi:predicted patatin/cPLA2 family phospholipase